MTIPCGGCVGCRLARSQAWAVRLQHEASLHEAKAFLTLTYSDQWLPEDYSLDPKALQDFMKRLRYHTPDKVRFFACGEYGDETLRPHYHLILFGEDFIADRLPFRRTIRGDTTFISPKLQKLWPFGYSEIGSVTVDSCAYVARYIMKKVTGAAAADHYRRVHPLTGELVSVVPEFVTMSKKPGIGAGWFDQFSGDCFPSDFIVCDGRKYPIPRYYLKKLDDEAAGVVVFKRKKESWKRKHDNTPERLAVREELTKLKVERLKRDLT